LSDITGQIHSYRTQAVTGFYIFLNTVIRETPVEQLGGAKGVKITAVGQSGFRRKVLAVKK